MENFVQNFGGNYLKAVTSLELDLVGTAMICLMEVVSHMIELITYEFNFGFVTSTPKASNCNGRPQHVLLT
jgi:hypothetical protein